MRPGWAAPRRQISRLPATGRAVVDGSKPLTLKRSPGILDTAREAPRPPCSKLCSLSSTLRDRPAVGFSD